MADTEELLEEKESQDAVVSSIDDDLFDDPDIKDEGLTEEDLKALNMSPNKLRKVLKRKIESGYKRGRQEAMQDMNVPIVDQTAASPQPIAQPVSGQMQNSVIPSGGMTAAQVEQLIAQRDAEKQQLQYNQRIDGINEEFANRVMAGNEKYPELSEKVRKLGLRSQGAQALVIGVTSLDNTADIMKELAEDPTKYVNLVKLMEEAPEAAKDKLLALSQSIKLNQQANQSAKSNIDEPLSRIRSSISANSSDNGERSIGDWEKFLESRR